MKRQPLLFIFHFSLLIFFAASCTKKTPEQQFIDDAMNAVGGRSRVEQVKTIAIEASGVNYNLGQDIKPEASTQQFAITGYIRKIDVAQGKQRVEQTRTPKFAYFQGQQAQTQVMGLDGDVAYNVTPQGAVRIAPAQEADRRIEFMHHPITALRAAIAPATTISNVRTSGAVRQADFEFRDRKWTMTIDAAGVPLSISTKSYHPNLGDVVVTTTFAQYDDVNGLKLPKAISGKVDDFTTYELAATKQFVDADLGDINAPPEAIKPVQVAPPNVVVTPVGKGVWLLAGQSHHSVLVEFSDHLMLIEAPQSEARTLAVIAKAKETVNNKPLTQLVTTHHHFDHTAGMRAAIAEGMTVITQAGNRAWVDNMARRSHSLQPDMLTKNASRLEIDTVDEEKEIKDASMTVQLFHVAGNPHSDTMLMAYFPALRVLVEVDAFSPGAAVNPYAANLLENINTRKLKIDRIVPLHGTIAPFADLVKVATPAKGN
jgi:glyoxylase-like metal-dependent hydrolase (beta-lactamase superfamily II)